MADAIWKNSRRQTVLFEAGNFGGDVNSPKFTQAPFDLVKIDGDIYLQPIHTMRGGAMPGQIDSGIGNDTADEAFTLSQAGEFYLEPTPMTMGAHQMGDYSGDQNSWRGVHLFNRI